MEEFVSTSRKSQIRKSTSTVTVIVIIIGILMVTMPIAEAFPVYTRNGRHNHGNGGVAAGSASQSNGQRGARTPRPGANGSGSVTHPTYTIEKPQECRNETVFSDCFLCGKISDDIRIYRACCNRDAEIIIFCHRLLS